MEGKRSAVGRSDGFYEEIEQFVEEEERVLEVKKWRRECIRSSVSCKGERGG